MQKVLHQSPVSLANTDLSTIVGTAGVDTVKAATIARTVEKRIVCEVVMCGKIDLDWTVRRRLVIKAYGPLTRL